jgi:hypothetical protein
VNAQLSKLAELIARGKLKDASALLNRIDARFGGLAAPCSVELWQQIESPPLILALRYRVSSGACRKGRKLCI